MTYDDALEFLEEHPGYPPMHRFDDIPIEIYI
jgi:hypothetical protein